MFNPCYEYCYLRFGKQYTEDLIKSYKVNSKKDDASCLELKLWNPQGFILRFNGFHRRFGV